MTMVSVLLEVLMIAPPRPACANGAWASLLRVLAVACIAGAHVSAAPASIAASEDSFGSLGPGGYADYPLDVDEPPRPEEMELEAMQPEPPEDPVDGLPPPPAPGPADLPAGAISSLCIRLHAIMAISNQVTQQHWCGSWMLTMNGTVF